MKLIFIYVRAAAIVAQNLGSNFQREKVVQDATKPMVDVGLLFQVLKTHSTGVQNLGVYEGISKRQKASPAGPVHSMDLMTGLAELEPSCQIHPSSLRTALMQLLAEEPAFDNSKFKGSIFVNLRMERIGVVVFHFR